MAPRYLVVEVYEHDRGCDSNDEESGPVVVVDGVVGVLPQLRHLDLFRSVEHAGRQVVGLPVLLRDLRRDHGQVVQFRLEELGSVGDHGENDHGDDVLEEPALASLGAINGLK